MYICITITYQTTNIMLCQMLMKLQYSILPQVFQHITLIIGEEKHKNIYWISFFLCTLLVKIWIDCLTRWMRNVYLRQWKQLIMHIITLLIIALFILDPCKIQRVDGILYVIATSSMCLGETALYRWSCKIYTPKNSVTTWDCVEDACINNTVFYEGGTVLSEDAQASVKIVIMFSGDSECLRWRYSDTQHCLNTVGQGSGWGLNILIHSCDRVTSTPSHVKIFSGDGKCLQLRHWIFSKYW